MSPKQHGMPITVRCAILGHRWGKWSPVGHIEGAEWRSCKRGCGIGQMQYPDSRSSETSEEEHPDD